MVEVVDEEDGAQLLGLEAARKLHQKVHACIAHAIQIMVQLAILRTSTTNCWSHRQRYHTNAQSKLVSFQVVLPSM